jgi:hypothetical protein
LALARPEGCFASSGKRGPQLLAGVSFKPASAQAGLLAPERAPATQHDTKMSTLMTYQTNTLPYCPSASPVCTCADTVFNTRTKHIGPRSIQLAQYNEYLVPVRSESCRRTWRIYLCGVLDGPDGAAHCCSAGLLSTVGGESHEGLLQHGLPDLAPDAVTSTVRERICGAEMTA